MPEIDTTKVAEKPVVEVAKPTLNPDGSPVAPVATQTETAPSDAELKLKEFEEKLNKSAEDLNRLKSASQRRENELRQESERRVQELKAELERAKVADMDEEERKIYEQEMAVIKAQELQSTVNQLTQEKSELEAYQKALDWFADNDVPLSALVKGQGYDALFESGWAYINEERKTLRNKAGGFIEKEAPKEPPKAPAVVTTTAAVPGTGPTWQELETRYGSREEVYRLVETGQLSNSVIPLKK